MGNNVKKGPSFCLARQRMQKKAALLKQASIHALCYALAAKGLHLSAPRVAAIFGFEKLASWKDWNQVNYPRLKAGACEMERSCSQKPHDARVD